MDGFLISLFLFFFLFSPLVENCFLALRHPRYILHCLCKSHGSNINSSGKGFNFSYLWFGRAYLQLHNSYVAACPLTVIRSTLVMISDIVTPSYNICCFISAFALHFSRCRRKPYGMLVMFRVV